MLGLSCRTVWSLILAQMRKVKTLILLFVYRMEWSMELIDY